MIRKAFVLALGLAALAGFSMTARAHDMAGMSKGKPMTMKGEVVDTGCYMAHEARGEKHISCATKCINGGMPMGLLTADGRLYLLTLDHDNPDPYNRLKEMAGKQVTVTGTMLERAGMKGIDVTDAKLAAAVPAPKK